MCSQREFADQLSSCVAEGAEYAPYIEHVRRAKQINITFDETARFDLQ
jgi:hypothetical protein